MAWKDRLSEERDNLNQLYQDTSKKTFEHLN